jgi:hypothetical protein
VAKQFTLDEVAGDGSARHRQEGVIATRRILMDQTCQEGLARARLAGKEQGHFVRRSQRDALNKRQQAGRL